MMENEFQRVINMLSSGDDTTMRLGATIGLGLNPNLCMEYFRFFTVNSKNNLKGRHNYPILPVPRSLRGYVYTKGGIAFSFKGSFVECDYLYRFREVDSKYLINLDEYG